MLPNRSEIGMEINLRELSDDTKIVLVLNCADCGKELNRTKEIKARDYTLAVLSGPLNTMPCPNGCRSTASDMNMNTKMEIILIDSVPTAVDAELWSVKNP